MNIFIDTNVFLDLILKRENYKESLLIFDAIAKKHFDAVILDITILNIDYIAKKQTKSTTEFLTTVNQFIKVVGATNEMIEKALDIDNADLEDNLQYICAKKLKCKLIITNDKKFYSEDIEKFTSKDFVAKYL
jgi:predicted nucleic acid-binding protein